jgi:hypothetical protein
MVISADFNKQKQYFVKIIALSQYRFIAISQYCLQTSSSDEGLTEIDGFLYLRIVSIFFRSTLRSKGAPMTLLGKVRSVRLRALSGLKVALKVLEKTNRV